MPTTRPRYTLTDTSEIAEAIDDAAKAWPELHGDRAAIIRKLVEVGHRSVIHDLDDLVSRRTRALRQAAGAVTGTYPADAASALKSEWPE